MKWLDLIDKLVLSGWVMLVALESGTLSSKGPTPFWLALAVQVIMALIVIRRIWKSEP